MLIGPHHHYQDINIFFKLSYWSTLWLSVSASASVYYQYVEVQVTHPSALPSWFKMYLTRGTYQFKISLKKTIFLTLSGTKLRHKTTKLHAQRQSQFHSHLHDLGHRNYLIKVQLRPYLYVLPVVNLRWNPIFFQSGEIKMGTMP